MEKKFDTNITYAVHIRVNKFHVHKVITKMESVEVTRAAVYSFSMCTCICVFVRVCIYIYVIELKMDKYS